MTYSKSDIKEAKDNLLSLDLATHGIIIVINSVSRSGMTRRMHVYTSDANQMLTARVATSIEWSFNDMGIKVDGCGMNMALHLADTLTWALYGDKRHEMSKVGLFKGNGGSCIE